MSRGNNKRGEFSPLTIHYNMEKDVICSLMAFFGGLMFAAAIINLFFCPSWFGIHGLWLGACLFLLGIGEIETNN